jgi:hypothetical protein
MLEGALQPVKAPRATVPRRCDQAVARQAAVDRQRGELAFDRR